MSEDIKIVALFGARVIFGQERANIDALAALQSEGCQVLCVIRPEEWPELLELRKVLDSRRLAWVTAPYIDYPMRGWLLHVALNNPRTFLRGNAALRRIVRDFRATHIHAFNPWYVASYYLAIRSLKLPMVYRAGDEPTRHNIIYRLIWKFILRHVTHFVADTEFIKSALIASGARRENVTVLYPPAPHREKDSGFHPPSVANAPDVIRFVYVGQIIQSKGVDLLVAAFREIAAAYPDAHLVIVGRISDWAGDDWARSLRSDVQSDEIIRERVHFLGFIENAPALMRHCHVHVAPSVRDEPLGLVVIEAKSVGRPSIIFESGGMSELIDDGIDGFRLADKSAESLFGAMSKYLKQPELIEQHGRAAQTSLDKLDLDSFSRKWRDIYTRA